MEVEYRIDDLARLAGTTVRNVRAYQDRGLVPKPRRDGRVGWYSEAHLARVRLIGQMLERGYGLANIRELLTAWEAGQDVADLLGLEEALGAPWTDQVPALLNESDLAAVFGAGAADADPDMVSQGIRQALEAGVLEATPDGYLVTSPKMLAIAAEMVAAGIPLPALLDLGRDLYRDVDRIARRFVDLVAQHVFEPLGEPLPPEEVPRLAEVVRRVRPLAQESVDTVLAEAMERHVGEELRARLGRMLGDRHTEVS